MRLLMPMSSDASTAVVYVSRSKPLLYLVRLGCVRRFVARARRGATWFVYPASSKRRCAPTAAVIAVCVWGSARRSVVGSPSAWGLVGVVLQYGVIRSGCWIPVKALGCARVFPWCNRGFGRSSQVESPASPLRSVVVFSVRVLVTRPVALARLAGPRPLRAGPDLGFALCFA